MFVLAFDVVVDLSIAPTRFRSDAVVAVTTKDPTLRVAAMQAAIADVISKPVLLRAAAALSDMPAPPPDVFESVAVTLGLRGSHPTGRDARLANRLKDEVDVLPGDLLGTMAISVSDPNAVDAARLANAITDAFIGDQDDHAGDLRRLRETALGARVDRLRASATAAHARLSALGGGADPAQVVALATARRVEAQSRLDAVHTIMAAGSPALSDRKDLPDSIAALEKTYVDLSSQLLRARETLGEKHTTIVSLKEGIARASTNLTAEWKRFERIARGELDTARAQEANVRNINPPLDASRQEARDAARLAAQQADDRVTKAESTRYDTIDDGLAYRLLSRAATPIGSTGFSQRARAMFAIGASLLMLTILMSVFMIRGMRRGASSKVAQGPHRGAHLAFVDDDGANALNEVDMPTPQIEPRVTPRPPRIRRPRVRTDHVRKATSTILTAMEAVHPRYGVSTLMIAANESDAESRPVALDLAYAIAIRGRRVLLVEGPRLEPALAANTDPDAAPILVDLFGTLRVMFRSDAARGILYVAPSFRNETGIASMLARDGDTPLVEEISREFDVLIYDGGQAGSLNMLTDLYLRVGRFASPRADAQFLEAFDQPDAVFLGTMIEHVFAPAETGKPASVKATSVDAHDAVAVSTLTPRRAPLDRSRRVRIKSAMMPRRRAGVQLS